MGAADLPLTPMALPLDSPAFATLFPVDLLRGRRALPADRVDEGPQPPRAHPLPRAPWDGLSQRSVDHTP